MNRLVDKIRVGTVICLITATALVGCKGKVNPPMPKQAAAEPTPLPAPAVPKVKLPRLEELQRPAAKRVVHLIYTSNVDGEIDPCG